MGTTEDSWDYRHNSIDLCPRVSGPFLLILFPLLQRPSPPLWGWLVKPGILQNAFVVVLITLNHCCAENWGEMKGGYRQVWEQVTRGEVLSMAISHDLNYHIEIMYQNIKWTEIIRCDTAVLELQPISAAQSLLVGKHSVCIHTAAAAAIGRQ